MFAIKKQWLFSVFEITQHFIPKLKIIIAIDLISSAVEGLWDTECPYTRTIGSAASPITKMLAVAGKLWCGCQNQIHVINPLALNIEVGLLGRLSDSLIDLIFYKPSPP